MIITHEKSVNGDQIYDYYDDNLNRGLIAVNGDPLINYVTDESGNIIETIISDENKLTLVMIELIQRVK